MSQDHQDEAHEAHHDAVALPHASLRDYGIGFALSVALTAIPFALVMAGPLSHAATGVIVLAFAVVQIIVHMVYFLHMSPKAEGGWTMTSLIFTVIVVGIMLAGSLWVMHHLNVNMMPMPHDMREMP